MFRKTINKSLLVRSCFVQTRISFQFILNKRNFSYSLNHYDPNSEIQKKQLETLQRRVINLQQELQEKKQQDEEKLKQDKENADFGYFLAGVGLGLGYILINTF